VLRLVVLIALLAFVAAGCAGDDESASEQPPVSTTPAATQPPAPAPEEPAEVVPFGLYTKGDLARLVLQPDDAPFGMRYMKEESGPRTFFDVGLVLEEQLAEVRKLGLRGIYDATFDSTTTDLRLATRAWLFAKANGATEWLEKTKTDSTLFALQPIMAPRLGEGSWAAGGEIAGNVVISHAFRAGNVVVVVTMSTQTRELSESDALTAAQNAVGRVRLASN
jgi:hypothetical protein